MSTLVEQLSARQWFRKRLPPPWMSLHGCRVPRGLLRPAGRWRKGVRVTKKFLTGQGGRRNLSSAHVVQKAGGVVSFVPQKRTLVWETADLCHTPLQGLLPEVMKRNWVSGYFPCHQIQLVCKAFRAALLRAVCPLVKGMVWMHKLSEELIKDQSNHRSL